MPYLIPFFNPKQKAVGYNVGCLFFIMNIRKVKKIIKSIYEPKWIKVRLTDLKYIRLWANKRNKNVSNNSICNDNMKILTGNFYRKGKFI